MIPFIVMKNLSEEDIKELGIDVAIPTEENEARTHDAPDQSEESDERDRQPKRRKYSMDDLAPYLNIKDRFKPIADPRFDARVCSHTTKHLLC